MEPLRSLAKRIGRQEILCGVDLDIARGETLAIIGRSGGGKSVLLKHLVGLMQPDTGEIWIEGENIIGRAQMIFFSIAEGEHAWMFWRWPTAVRWNRIFSIVR